MSLHRLEATFDVVTAFEFHLPTCVGASVLCWQGAIPFWQKNAPDVMIGSVSGNNPMGLTHDTGPLRPHILVCVSVEPASATAMSIAISALATLTSSCKPMFSPHKVQVVVGGLSLPVTVDSIPMVPVLLSGVVCSCPGLPTLSGIPTQMTVLAGMTLGDILGGVVNCLAESAMQLVWELVGLFGGDAATTGARVMAEIGLELPEMFAASFHAGAGLGGGSASTGPENYGRYLQEAIDQDGVGSDAYSSFRILGFGGTAAPGQGPMGSTQAGSEFTAPWSSTPRAGGGGGGS